MTTRSPHFLSSSNIKSKLSTKDIVGLGAKLYETLLREDISLTEYAKKILGANLKIGKNSKIVISGDSRCSLYIRRSDAIQAKESVIVSAICAYEVISMHGTQQGVLPLGADSQQPPLFTQLRKELFICNRFLYGYREAKKSSIQNVISLSRIKKAARKITSYISVQKYLRS